MCRVAHVESEVDCFVKCIANPIAVEIPRTVVLVNGTGSASNFHLIRPGVLVVIKVLDKGWCAG